MGNERLLLPPQPASCWFCKKEIASNDRFCRHCGKGQGSHVPWYYKHGGIIALTLLALGPFSLFLVWRSPLLNRRSQWIYTGAIAGFTCYLCVTAYHLWLQICSLATSALQGGLIQPLQ